MSYGNSGECKDPIVLEKIEKIQSYLRAWKKSHGIKGRIWFYDKRDYGMRIKITRQLPNCVQKELEHLGGIVEEHLSPSGERQMICYIGDKTWTKETKSFFAEVEERRSKEKERLTRQQREAAEFMSDLEAL